MNARVGGSKPTRYRILSVSAIAPKASTFAWFLTKRRPTPLLRGSQGAHASIATCAAASAVHQASLCLLSRTMTCQKHVAQFFTPPRMLVLFCFINL